MKDTVANIGYQEYDHIPEKISERDLGRYFTLSNEDKAQVLKCRGAHNVVGYALQICSLRMRGKFISDFSSLPSEAVNYVAAQFRIPPFLIFDYPQRQRTRWEHEESVREYLGYRQFDAKAEEDLQEIVLKAALQTDKTHLLVESAIKSLRNSKIILPSISTIERLVGSTRKQANQIIYDTLDRLLTEDQKKALDNLLIVSGSPSKSKFYFLKESPHRATPSAILRELDKIDFIREIGIQNLNFSWINPNKRKYLALLARRYTTTPLQRFDAKRRHAVMACFLSEILTESIDTAVEMHDIIMTGVFRRAARNAEDIIRGSAQSLAGKITLLKELCQLILSDKLSDAELRSYIYQQIPKEEIESTAKECESLLKPLDYSCFDQVARRYPYMRRYASRLLGTIGFRPIRKREPLSNAIEYLKRCNQNHQRKLTNPPIEFVPKKWRSYVVKDDRVDHRSYEICLLSELKNAVRSADLWVVGSRSFAEFKSYLFNDSQWEKGREVYYEELGLPADSGEFIQDIKLLFGKFAERADNNLPDNPWAKVENGRLHLSRLDAETIPQMAIQLKEELESSFPKVTLSQLLIEVNRLTKFIRHFTHLSEKSARSKEIVKGLFACLIAQGCNIGLYSMAEATRGISYRQLAYVADWYIREETLRRANIELINFHHKHPLSYLWGDGTVSMSDGQRFGMPVDSIMAEFHPRYFAHFGRGVTVYTHQSDQYSQFYTQLIHCSPREAAYVLDGLLDHETDLNPYEHFTDTHGYTENVFSLCHLLGFRFSPRIRDIADQRLYRIDKDFLYKNIDPLFSGHINIKLIREEWDEIVRLVASVKNRVVKPSLLLRKMGAYSRKSRLLKAIQEIGRIVKTIFILNYIDDKNLRRRIQLHLNRNESKHALARYLFFGSQGELRIRDYEGQINRMTSLTLLINAILVWNTVHLHRQIQEFKSQGKTLAKENLSHISPLMYSHINPYGEYHFDLTDEDL